MRMRVQESAAWLNESTINQSLGVAPDQDVASLASARLLFHRIKVGFAHLSNRMCPVQLADGTGQVWVLAEHAHDDQAKALALAMAQSGLVLAKPARLVVSASWLSQLNRQLQSDAGRLQGLGARASTPKHVLMSLLDDLLGHALDCDASDIHLTVRPDWQFADVALTINGMCVRPKSFAQLPACTVQELLSVTWMTVEGGNGAVFDATREQQGRFEREIGARRVSLRWASLVLQSGVSVCWRLLNRLSWHTPPALQALGYEDHDLPRLARATRGGAGLVVFAGLVGSGKSTSLAALMRMIPTTRKLITLEDPVEYVIDNALQCAVAGFDQQSASAQLASKLKTIKRSAAHDVLIGELRDALGAQAAVDLVLAGSTVYTTVHASCALQILTRLSSSLIGVPKSLLSMPGFLKLLVYQVLLKRLCDCALTCQQWVALGPSAHRRQAWLDMAQRELGQDQAAWRFRNPAGCQACTRSGQAFESGYGHRLLVAEFLEPATMAGFYEELTEARFDACVAQWQGALAHSPGVLERYQPVAQTALAHVNAGRIDPRDYCARFAPATADPEVLWV